jgi:hypothetical protein
VGGVIQKQYRTEKVHFKLAFNTCGHRQTSGGHKVNLKVPFLLKVLCL